MAAGVGLARLPHTMMTSPAMTWERLCPIRMPGFMLASTSSRHRNKKGMDGRNKPGHDVACLVPRPSALTLRERHVGPRVGSVIKSERTQQDVVLKLLEHLYDPTWYAPDGKDRHEEIAFDAEQVVDDTGIEIDIHVHAVARIWRHGCDHRLQNLEPFRLAPFLRQTLDAGAHVTRARILRPIDAMPETGDGNPRLAFFLHIIRSARGIADLFRHLHHILGGAAMRRPRQRGNRRDDRSMEIGFR